MLEKQLNDTYTNLLYAIDDTIPVEWQDAIFFAAFDGKGDSRSFFVFSDTQDPRELIPWTDIPLVFGLSEDVCKEKYLGVIETLHKIEELCLENGEPQPYTFVFSAIETGEGKELTVTFEYDNLFKYNSENPDKSIDIKQYMIYKYLRIEPADKSQKEIYDELITIFDNK